MKVGTRAVDDPEQGKCRRKARRMLRKMGFDDGAVQRAGDALKPKLSHRAQIEKIVVRLGLASDGDIAKLWIALNDSYGRVHERSFHESLKVDDAFRTDYARITVSKRRASLECPHKGKNGNG